MPTRKKSGWYHVSQYVPSCEARTEGNLMSHFEFYVDGDLLYAFTAEEIVAVGALFSKVTFNRNNGLPLAP